MKWPDSVREMRRSGLGKSHAPMSGASDAELTDLARAADEAAFAELYVRHRRAALATARYLAPSGVDADDVVADAFAGVWGALRNGHGPQDDFRSYLMACVRNACRSRRTRATPLPADIIEDAAGGRVVGERPLLEDPERYVEADTVARAFATLTPRWQHALWVTAVEERSPADVSRELKLSPNATAALTMRARQAFASAYLAEHVSVTSDPACAAVAPLLAPYVRDRLGVAERAPASRSTSPSALPARPPSTTSATSTRACGPCCRRRRRR